MVKKEIDLDCICTSGMSGSPIVASNGVIDMAKTISFDGTRTQAVSSDTILDVLRVWNHVRQLLTPYEMSF